MKINAKDIIIAAERARLASYSPYSGFAVGAALLCSDGKIYEGCNIENASYTPTCCAERVALFKAVSEGRRDFVAIAIVGGAKGSDERGFCYPCGVCRQVLSEFSDGDLPVFLGNSKGEILELTLGELLPYTFKLKTDGE
ncbi:MAG: cytidine deaminase [Clostridia bacterium]|nr:cytidine deaminase [Clostridia bacterium]